LTSVFFTRTLPQCGGLIFNVGHFSPHLPAFWQSWQGCWPFSQLLQSLQGRPGSSVQNGSHFTSQQYFFTFSMPHTIWHVYFLQPHALPQRAQLSAEPAVGPQGAPPVSSATARAASKESEIVKTIPIFLMFMFSSDRSALRSPCGNDRDEIEYWLR
jgi:hypothetical protein